MCTLKPCLFCGVCFLINSLNNFHGFDEVVWKYLKNAKKLKNHEKNQTNRDFLAFEKEENQYAFLMKHYNKYTALLDYYAKTNITHKN